MNKNASYEQFLKETKKNYNDLLSEYNATIENARDGFKKSAHYRFYNKINNELHPTVQKKLNIYSRFFLEIQDELEANKNKEFESEFIAKFSQIKGDDKIELLRNLSELAAIEKIFDHLREERKTYDLDSNIVVSKDISNIKWKGENITEFTQLVYGLFHGGYLTNSTNEIEKLVEDVAKAFNVTLTNNWASNLSKSIHKSKAGYEPQIFKNSETAFKRYMDDLIKKKKEN